VADGAQLRAFPRPVLEAAQSAAFELYGELAEKSRHFQRIYAPWLKFRASQFLWFRIAEMSYDNFVFTSAVRPAARKK
jgi:TRAP-type mannitol/chloroaromatic compound transport system substrate-binding protein